ncbi:NAD-dependent epimerase/dehydratase family protein [Nonomuraea sp. NPDC049400]|uniref:NAD-dependent epimerase/dehydratase family protein n=1 Tax=Nonomuraea sp. NPDC049400 TaxID=3364352 RepID=UPI003799992C
MKLLVLGGTSFVGRAIVNAALSRGHAVTTFNRGRTGSDVPGVAVLRGDRDRDDGLNALQGRTFDAAIDTSGLVPAQTLRTVHALSRSVGFYAYVSSVSVYADWERTRVDEESRVLDADPYEDGDPGNPRRYAVRKAGSERAVALGYPADRSLILRPGTIVGPYDNVGHLLWWLQRIAQGGEVLAPGSPDRGLQLLDVRDMADFLVARVENWAPGVLNMVPCRANTTMGGLLRAMASVTGSDPEFVWASDQELLEAEVLPWLEMPFWLPDQPRYRAAWAVSGDRAAASGLDPRPIEDTLGDTWQWLAAGGAVSRMPGSFPPGMTRLREQKLLQALRVWKEKPWDAPSGAHESR